MMSFLIDGLTHSSWFATPENEWAELFIPYIPGWLAMTDRDVLKQKQQRKKIMKQG
jgi:hypothetical protein